MKIEQMVARCFGKGMSEDFIAEVLVSDADCKNYFVSVSECDGQKMVRIGEDSLLDYFGGVIQDVKEPVEFYTGLSKAKASKFYEAVKVANTMYKSIGESF